MQNKDTKIGSNTFRLYKIPAFRADELLTPLILELEKYKNIDGSISKEGIVKEYSKLAPLIEYAFFVTKEGIETPITDALCEVNNITMIDISMIKIEVFSYNCSFLVNGVLTNTQI